MRRNGCSRSPAWPSSPCSHWRSSVPTSSARYWSGSSASTQPAGPGTVANSPTTGTSAVTNSTDVPANADADQSKLWLAIPKPIRRGSCKFADSEHAGGVATINCDYDDPKHGRTLVHLDRFVDFAHLQVIYKLHGPGSVAAHGGAPDPQLKKATGGCNRTLWRGEGPWSHEAGGGVMGPVSGRYSCYQADGQCDLVKKMNLTDVNGSTACDRLELPRCHHVREGRAANECARRNRVLLRFPASPVWVRMPASERPATDWLEAVKDAERRGELLTAVDLAEQGLAERPDDLWLKHRAVLALARARAQPKRRRGGSIPAGMNATPLVLMGYFNPIHTYGATTSWPTPRKPVSTASSSSTCRRRRITSSACRP